jgi:lysozyme-like protein
MMPHSAAPMTRLRPAIGRLVLIGAIGVALGTAGSASPAVADVGQSRPASIGAGSIPGHARPAGFHDAMKCARPAYAVRFHKDRAIVAIAVGMAESYCRKNAVGHNPPSAGCPKGSDDRGLWQINSCYHSEVSDHCAFKPTCNARAAKHISDRGRDWTPWSAYNNGAYRQYLDEATHAVHRLWDR